MELPLDSAALDKPTAEIVRPIYEALVTTFLGVTRYAAVCASNCCYYAVAHDVMSTDRVVRSVLMCGVWLQITVCRGAAACRAREPSCPANPIWCSRSPAKTPCTQACLVGGSCPQRRRSGQTQRLCSRLHSVSCARHGAAQGGDGSARVHGDRGAGVP